MHSTSGRIQSWSFIKKSENCPDGQLDTVRLSKIEFVNSDDAENDIVHIETLSDGFSVKGGQNPGEVASGCVLFLR